MVSIDAGVLGLLLYPNVKPPDDPKTKKPVERASERIEKLQEDLDLARERIIIPTPALSEFLVLAGKAGSQYLNEISNQPIFYIKPFDQMAAVELAAMELMARTKGAKRLPAPSDTPWQKVKFDRQIVAISKLHGAHTIYSDDRDIRNIAEDIGIKVVSCWELDLPISKTPLLDSLPPEPDPEPPLRKFRFDEE
jgi:predicted nucleic acid-binding protein